MFKIIAVSNRGLCRDDFISRVKSIADEGIKVILREKDLLPEEYARLLDKVKSDNIIPHTFYKEAAGAGFRCLHLPLFMLRENPMLAEQFNVGVSIHSPNEAIEAQKLGAVYVTAGHIYTTDCKKGIPGRGIEYLKNVKSSVDISVYAIGGIKAENIKETAEAGADGACVMSGFMGCGDIHQYVRSLRSHISDLKTQ